MIEKNPIGSKHPVTFPVIPGHPVRIEFGAGIRAAGLEEDFFIFGGDGEPNISLEEAW
jgi:hypothetical protein